MRFPGRGSDPWADLLALEELEAKGATAEELANRVHELESQRCGGVIGKVVGRTLPVGHFHTARPAFTLRGTRKRADRIRTLEQEHLRCFRLAATNALGDTFWWTPQLAGSPMCPEPGKVVFSFVGLELVEDLALRAWWLVDDDGYLVRLRRECITFSKGVQMDAAYVLAFDGSDKNL